jgi:putative GTP pyrophosphokinase
VVDARRSVEHRDPIGVAGGAMDLGELTELRLKGRELGEFLLPYKFALEELNTKVTILREELAFSRGVSPIEHVATRLKSPESLAAKVRRVGCGDSLEEIREQVRDIAGVRLVCSFISDTYDVMEMLISQPDIRVLEVEDYIADPKPNGYRSLHLILELPVFLSDRVAHTPVEVQIRTVAMDFWASLEHKIYYRYDQTVPEHLLTELAEAARSARDLDETMQRLHLEVRGAHRMPRRRS